MKDDDDLDIEFIEDEEPIESVIKIEGVWHKWDSLLMEYRPVDSRKVDYSKKGFLH